MATEEPWPTTTLAHGLVLDGIFDGIEIRGVQKTPWKTAPSGDDMNPSLSATFIVNNQCVAEISAENLGVSYASRFSVRLKPTRGISRWLAEQIGIVAGRDRR